MKMDYPLIIRSDSSAMAEPSMVGGSMAHAAMMLPVNYDSGTPEQYMDLTEQVPREKLAQFAGQIESFYAEAVQDYQSAFAENSSGAWARYFGNKRGNEVKGLSSVVTRETAEVADDMKDAGLRAIFNQGAMLEYRCGNNGQAQSDQDYFMMARHIENVIRQHPESRKIISQFLLTAAVEKVAFLAVEPYTPPPKIESLTNQSMIDVAILEQDPTIEIMYYAAEDDIKYEGGKKFHLYIRRKQDSRTLIQFVPNSHMLWQRNCRTFDQSLPTGPSYMARVEQYSVDEALRRFPNAEGKILRYGSEEELFRVQNNYTQQQFSSQVGDQYGAAGMMGFNEPFTERRMVAILDEYVRFDLNGDGIAELVNVKRIGRQIVHLAPVADNPFVWWSPDVVPSRAVGQSLDDKVKDLSIISTDITRASMNLAGLAYRPRTAVNMNMGEGFMSKISATQTHDDLTKGGIGAIIRTAGDPREAISTITNVHQEAPLNALALRSLVRGDITRRTGFGDQRVGGANGSDSVGRTATGIHMMQKASYHPTEGFIMNFAEGIKILAKKTLRCEIAHGRMVQVKVNGEVLDADPRYWDFEAHCGVHMSGAVLDADSRMAHLNSLLNVAMPIIENMGPDNPIISLQEMRNILEELVRTMGFSDSPRFLKESSVEAIQQWLAEQQDKASQPDPAKMAELELKAQEMVIKAEIEMQEMMIKAEMEQLEIYLKYGNEAGKIAIEASLKKRQMAIEEKLEEKRIKSQEKISRVQPVKVGGEKTG